MTPDQLDAIVREAVVFKNGHYSTQEAAVIARGLVPRLADALAHVRLRLLEADQELLAALTDRNPHPPRQPATGGHRG